MTRLKKIANKELNLQLCQYILDLVSLDVEPIIMELKNSGIGYGYNEVLSKLADISREYEFISKKTQKIDIPTDISWYCSDSIQKIKNCKSKLQRWYEDYSSMATETQDDIYEKEEFEYQADELVVELMETLLLNNSNIQNEVEKLQNRVNIK